MNRFADGLSSGRLLVTAEYLPPRGSDADAVRLFSSALPKDLDAIVVADNPDAVRSSALSAAILLTRERGAGVVVSMTTRDRNRIALFSDALGAAALNIDGILCVSGNHQSLGVCPQAAAANDIDAVQFTRSMKDMILHGSGLNGKQVEPPIELQVGATAHPYMRPMDLNLVLLRKKVIAGADFLLTQAVFDMDGFSQWMDFVCQTGLDKRTAIFPSVLPLPSVQAARKLQRSQIYGPIPEEVIARISTAPDAAREGVAIAAEIAARLKSISGVRGIHILGGCESLVSAVIQKAGI
jgi:methylenetetrahydrofolate reductase (NADPH)